jgi:hypothetical protein
MRVCPGQGITRSSSNVLIPRLSAVTVAIVTRTEGPVQTHISVDSESGLTGYDVSHVSATELHSVDKSRLRRGRLHPSELADWNQPSAFI